MRRLADELDLEGLVLMSICNYKPRVSLTGCRSVRRRFTATPTRKVDPTIFRAADSALVSSAKALHKAKSVQNGQDLEGVAHMSI
jgi:hypothetical protein